MSAIVTCFILLASSPLMAQDFGKTWVDRVVHTLVEDEGPLTPVPVTWSFVAGELYSYDSNVFLTNTNRENDSIFTTFAGATVKYASPTFDAEGDLLVNYNAYASTDDASADEERFFGRIRYQGTNVSLGLAEIARRESSPTDAVFVTRASRFVSNTTPSVIVHMSPVVALELTSDLQLVDYLRSAYDTVDNFNSRTILTFAYTTGWNEVDLLVQAGYTAITYQDSFAAPDSDGFLGRLGLRGAITPKLNVSAVAGVASMKSDDYVGTNNNVEMNTADIEIHVGFTPDENTTWQADYSRRFGFSTGGSPFQVVDAAGLLGKINVREDVTIRSRFQYSRVHESVGGLRRAYYDVGIGGEYKVHPHILLDAGFTWRWGVTPGTNGVGNFGDAILSFGAAVLF